MLAGQLAKFRGTWGTVVFTGKDYVWLTHWRGQMVVCAPLDEITEVKSDERCLETRHTKSAADRQGVHH